LKENIKNISYFCFQKNRPQNGTTFSHPLALIEKKIKTPMRALKCSLNRIKRIQINDLQNYLQMKQIITLLFATLPLISFSQSDPREFNHGTCIVKYLDNNNNKYYLTWSSSYPDGWEHDIYKSKIYFDTNGNLVTETPNQVFINTYEAQEPVNSVINSDNNYMLTVWEDGSGANAPNVSGQINLPDGTIIRQNWIIAGGSGSQHSAYTSHLSDKFLIFYADEAPPVNRRCGCKSKSNK